MNRSNDVKSKVARWQNNNSVDSKCQSPARPSEAINDVEKAEEKYLKRSDSQKAWEEQRMEEILENERKNSKNEVNAKLNNQENYDVMETKKSNADDSQRKIKRIDLKAYGFENDFFLNENRTKTSAPRVVNKLDLKSFGYDGGIRRTQSNIHLNTMHENEFKRRLANKSNLTCHHDFEHDSNVMETRASGDNDLTRSTEALNKFRNDTYNGFGLKSAKSVPNIARCYSNASSSHEDEEVEGYSQNSYNRLGMMKNGSAKNVTNNYSVDKCTVRSSESSIDESGNETDNSSEKEQSHQSMTNGEKKASNDNDLDKKLLPMPSVRRLAQTFNKQPEPAPVPVSKATKPSNLSKDRSSTPEIQIVETPRQMHSLTARSLSKQFREGLRQIPNKVTSPPASHVTMEQKIPENQTEVVQATSDVMANDTNVILPGKLKSNIIFWEQMQRKS